MFSLRRRSAAVAAATVTTALACGGLAALTVANASTPATAQAPATPLSVFASVPAYATAPLVHGLGTETVTFTVRNNTGHAVAFHPLVEGWSHGVFPVTPSEVSLGVDAVQAPATGVVRTGHDNATFDRLVPAGKPSGSAFTVPAKGSLTWKLDYGVLSSFPANNPDLVLDFQALAAPLSTSLAGPGASVGLGIAPGQSRPFAEYLTGGTTVAPGKPLNLDLTMANYTGAAVRGTFSTRFSADGPASAGKALLALDAWENGRWVTLTNLDNGNDWVLPPFSGTIANGSDHTAVLRLRVADGTDTAAATGTVDLSALTSLAQGGSGNLLSGFQLHPVAVSR
jgi:hypothetical protein